MGVGIIYSDLDTEVAISTLSGSLVVGVELDTSTTKKTGTHHTGSCLRKCLGACTHLMTVAVVVARNLFPFRYCNVS